LTLYKIKVKINIYNVEGSTKMKYISKSENQTFEIAKDFSKTLKAGDIIALSGDLGAGKTAFVKGVAHGLGCKDIVSSPTFTLVNEYTGTLYMLFHFDVYRLTNVTTENCDWIDEYLFSDGICIIEWADNLLDILPEKYIKINITKNPSAGEDYREIEIC